MTTSTTASAATPEEIDCSTSGNVTRSLLGYLALAGPFYVVVSVLQGLTRSGFSFAHNEWSLLALGAHGWIQLANFIISGAMTVAGAIGLRRALGAGTSGVTWAPRLLITYGVSLALAGAFRADAANGFPAGTPAGRAASISWHGTVHIIAGSVGFLCLIVACFVLARSYARHDERRLALASRVVGVVFAGAFIGIASGASNVAVNLVFTFAVVVSDIWLTTVAVNLYRRTRLEDGSARPAGR